MFGIHRYVLSLLVMVGHLAPLWSSWCGYYAVFAFYLLSGFLMTKVLRRRYGGSSAGVVRFLANRALRIHPPYWAVLGLTLGLLALWPVDVPRLHPSIRVPGDARAWIQNVLVIGLEGEAVRLVPPAWSLDVELVFYLVLAAVATRGRAVAFAWLAGSAAYTAWLVATGAAFADRYAPYGAASLPFALGCALQWEESRLRLAPWHAVLAPILFAGHAMLAVRLWGAYDGAAFYASLGLAAYSVAALAPRRASGALARLDAALGDLSYPLFLGHQVASIAVAMTWLGGARPPGGRLLLFTLPAVHALAFAVHAGVERPVERLRGRVRTRAARADT